MNGEDIAFLRWFLDRYDGIAWVTEGHAWTHKPYGVMRAIVQEWRDLQKRASTPGADSERG